MPRAGMAACICVALVGCRPDDTPCFYTQYETTTRSVTIASANDLAKLQGRCVFVRGDLRIESPDVLDLRGLEGVVGISRHLVIADSARLETTAGLDALELIGGDLIVARNPSLTDLELPELRSVGRSVELEGLPVLDSLAGLPLLTEVGGSLRVIDVAALSTWDLPAVAAVGGHLLIDGNASLREVDMPDVLFHVGGDVVLFGNPGLETVTGFDGLDEIGGEISIRSSWLRPTCIATAPGMRGRASGFTVYDNSALRHVSGFARIEQIQDYPGACGFAGSLTVAGNAALGEMLALPNLAHVDKLYVNRNTPLPRLPPWRAVDTGLVSIAQQPGILDLHWLASFASERAEIEANPDLRSLDGLTLRDEAYELSVLYNPALERFGDVKMRALGSLSVLSNGALSDVSGLLRLERVHNMLYVLWNLDLDQQHAEQAVEHLEPSIVKKVGSNAGWSAPDECPWTNDGECDETDESLGPILCRSGTDTEDCGP